MGIDDFFLLITAIDKRLTSRDVEYVFNAIDENGDNILSLEEFVKFFLSYDFSDLSNKAG